MVSCARGTPRTPVMPAVLVSVLNYVPSYEHTSSGKSTQAITLTLEGSDWSDLPLYVLVKSL
jgi:hypothetical protein